MLADPIADEPARAERGQETAGSSRSTMILIPVPMVQLARHDLSPARSKGSSRSKRARLARVIQVRALCVKTNLSGRCKFRRARSLVL